MAHLFLLRFQVEAVMVGRRHLNRHTIGDFETELGELINLIGVIGQKTHGLHAQIAQDLRADEVLAFISLEAQCKICFKRIHALVLQLVSAKLVYQADATTFLTHVQNYATALFVNRAHSRSELITAIAAQGAECIAGEAFRVNANQQIFPIGDIAFNQSNMGYGSCISVGIFVLSLLVIGGSQALIKYITREKEA